MKTLSIGWVYVLRILREPASLFFFFVFPVLMVFIIGIQFGGQGGRVKLGVYGDTGQSPTNQITANLATNEALELISYDSESEMLKAVERGMISAAAVFPSGMAEKLAAGQPVLIGFVAAPTGLGPQLEATVRQAVTEELIAHRAARFAMAVLGVDFQTSLGTGHAVGGWDQADHRRRRIDWRFAVSPRHGPLRRWRRGKSGVVHVLDRPNRGHRHGG